MKLSECGRFVVLLFSLSISSDIVLTVLPLDVDDVGS